MSALDGSGDIKGFFDLWAIYDRVLDLDYMFHRELYAEVSRTLAARFGERAFSVLDLGCGSGRHLAPVLGALRVERYEGHDLSPVALEHARKNFEGLGGEVKLVEGDLMRGLRSEGGERFDLIFSGFTLHHLSAEERAEVIRLARGKLAPGGLLLVLDSMRDEGQTREAWLDAYCGWIEAEWTAIPREGVEAIIGHIRGADRPGTRAEHDAAASAAGFARSGEIARKRWHVLWSAE
jgi:SAM-dependent methyltransferase